MASASREDLDLALAAAQRGFETWRDVSAHERCAVMRKREAPCMYYHIGRCPGPCAGKISREDYLARVGQIRKLLMGDTAQLLEPELD